MKINKWLEKRLGNKICKLRIFKGMNLAALAKKIKKTCNYLSQVERGIAKPSIMALRKNIKGFRCSNILFSGR